MGMSFLAGNKKADVMEHPWVFDHVGLLVNGPPGAAGLPFIKSSDGWAVLSHAVQYTVMVVWPASESRQFRESHSTAAWAAVIPHGDIGVSPGEAIVSLRFVECPVFHEPKRGRGNGAGRK